MNNINYFFFLILLCSNSLCLNLKSSYDNLIDDGKQTEEIYDTFNGILNKMKKEIIDIVKLTVDKENIDEINSFLNIQGLDVEDITFTSELNDNNQFARNLGHAIINKLFPINQENIILKKNKFNNNDIENLFNEKNKIPTVEKTNELYNLDNKSQSIMKENKPYKQYYLNNDMIDETDDDLLDNEDDIDDITSYLTNDQYSYTSLVKKLSEEKSLNKNIPHSSKDNEKNLEMDKDFECFYDLHEKNKNNEKALIINNRNEEKNLDEAISDAYNDDAPIEIIQQMELELKNMKTMHREKEFNLEKKHECNEEMYLQQQEKNDNQYF